MGSDWNNMTLGDFVTLQRGHDLPEKKRIDGDIPVLGSFGVTGWHNESRANGPGVTVGRSGASFGVVSYSPVNYWPLNTALYVNNFHGNNPKFAFYFLKTLDFKRYNSGSAQPSLNRNHIHPIPIAIPDLPEQKAIAHILGTLDDKIKLNRQMNVTLESMAQALFKSWFVDFDPVIDNALAAGNPIPEPLHARAETRKALGYKRKPLPEAIQKQFPNRFVFSEEKGWVPDGWGLGILGEVAKFKNGKKSPERISGRIPVFGSNGQIGFCSDHNREDVIVVGRVGTYCGSLFYSNSKCWVTDNAMTAEMVEKNDNIYLFEFLKLANLNDRRGGSGQPLLNQSILSSIKMINPDAKLISEYSINATSLYRKLSRNNEIIFSLSGLRDTLLPKLLSGQLRIPDAEKLVADAL